MEKTTEKATLQKRQGKRLKELAREHHYKNSQMMSFLGYENEKTVSALYSGRQKIKSDHIKDLANLFGVRENYLLCVDDWKTEDDMISKIHIKDIEEYRIKIDYLRSLGLQIEPSITSLLSPSTIYKNMDLITPYLTDETLSDLNNRFDFSLPYIDFCSEYFDVQNFPVTWRRPVDDLSFSFDDIGLNTKIGEVYPFGFDFVSDNLFVPSDDSRLKVNVSYSLKYNVTYKESSICRGVSISTFQKFIQKMDAFTECAIKTLLIDDNVSV